MIMEGTVTDLYHAVNHKFWFHLYFVILAHLIIEKENTVSINVNLQTNVQSIKTVWVLRNPCVLNVLFSPRKIGFISREVFMWNIRRKGHRESLLSHYLYLPLYTTCICICCVPFIHNMYLYCIYLWCVPSIQNLYLSLVCALYTQPIFISGVCPLYTTRIYLCCMNSIHNLYLSIQCALYT